MKAGWMLGLVWVMRSEDRKSPKREAIEEKASNINYLNNTFVCLSKAPTGGCFFAVFRVFSSFEALLNAS